jgi:hypothetical protein
MAKAGSLSLIERGTVAAASALLVAGSVSAAAFRVGGHPTDSARGTAPQAQERNSTQPPIGPGVHTAAASSSNSLPSVAAFQAVGGDLWSVGTAGWTDWKVGVAAGTSPAVVGLPNGGYEIAFQGSGNDLWSVGTAGWTDWHVGLAPGTSPSVVGLPNGGYEIAFQAAGQDLWTVGTAGWTDWHVGVAPGTSPAVVALPGGGYEVAFQAAGQDLWTVGTAGWTDWHVGVAQGTSPAIAGLPSGGFEAAFQAAGQDLWSVGSAGWTDWHVGVAARTSPSVVGLPTGGYQIAFQAVGNDLWTVGSAGWTNWGLSMAPGTSPGITTGAGGTVEVYQGSDGRLWSVGTGGYDWNVGVASGTDPSPLGSSTSSPTSQAASSQDNNFAFEVSNSAGAPARWNPCDKVHYIVVPAGAPAGWQNDVSNDISQALNATGLSFVSDGTAGSPPANYNGIVISWASQLSGGDTIGLTTYSYYNSAPFAPQIVSATIQLLSSLKAGGGMSGEQPVLLHELGHALGLAHVNAAEIMNPVDQGYGNYQPGDLNGLTHLGSSQGCSGFYS